VLRCHRCCALLAALLLLASGVPAGAQGSGEDPTAAASPRTRADCEAAGGTWRRMGLRGSERCDRAAPDAGRSCTTGDQCASLCVTDVDVPAGTRTAGRCYEHVESVGRCYNPVHRGVARGVICKD